MSVKVAHLREEMKMAQDLTKAGVLFVAIPVRSPQEHSTLRLMQASRIVEIAEKEKAL